MTNKELQDELKKYPDDSLVIKDADRLLDLPVYQVTFSKPFPLNGLTMNMANPARENYIIIK